MPVSGYVGTLQRVSGRAAPHRDVTLGGAGNKGNKEHSRSPTFMAWQQEGEGSSSLAPPGHGSQGPSLGPRPWWSDVADTQGAECLGQGLGWVSGPRQKAQWSLPRRRGFASQWAELANINPAVL